jgi:iron complex outermembrane receptor protein
MNRTIKYWLSGASVGLMALATQAAYAQSTGAPANQAPPSGETEGQAVVVTARRTAEKAQNVPVSITVVTQKALEEKNINNVNDIIYAAPGLSNQQTAGLHTGTTYSIRGQGEAYGQVSPGVVTYFSEVPSVAAATEFYDISDVQVLKGPQGTLFGRNTTGGAVLFTPNKPTNDFSGYFDARLGDYDRQEFEGAIGGAIIPDKVLFRIAGESLQRQGYTLNLFNGQHLDDENRWSFRAELDLKPTDNFENYTQFMYTSVDETGAGQEIGVITPTCTNGGVQSALICNNPLTNPGLPALLAGFVPGLTDPANWAAMQAALAAQRARGPRFADINSPTTQKERAWVAINTTTWNVTNFLTLKNIFSYQDSEADNAYDFDGSPLSLGFANNPFLPVQTYTEEFQGQFKQGPFSGSLGFFTTGSSNSLAVFIDPAFEYDPVEAAVDPAASGGSVPFWEATGGKSSSYAVYGQGNVEVLPGLILTAGYRYTWDQTTSTFAESGTSAAGALAGPFTTDSAKFQAPTWTFAADYKVNSDVSVYATVRRGYKDGGLNATAQPPESPLFQPEYVTDYEAGVKTSFRLGGVRTVFDIDGFYDDYTNIQRVVNEPTSPPSSITTNAAAGAIDGLDVDLTVVPSKYFDLSVLYTYTNAWYTKWSDPTYGNLSGQKFQDTPANQLTVTPRIHYPLPGNLGRLTLSANIYYQSVEALDPYNVPNGNPNVALSVLGANVPGYAKVDLRLEWADMFGKGITGAVFVQNLTNQTIIVGSSSQLTSLLGLDSYTYGAPRMIGVELNYKFGAR